MTLIEKLTWLKRILIINFALSLAFSALGLEMGVYLFVSQSRDSHEVDEVSHMLVEGSSVLSLIDQLAESNGKSPKELFKKWQSVQAIQNLKLFGEHREKILETGEPPEVNVNELKASLRTQLAQGGQKLQQVKASFHRHQLMVFVVGLGTFLFGLLIPITIGAIIQRKISAIQREITSQVQQWLKEILDQRFKLGPEAHHQAEFWVEAILLSVERFAPYAKSPALAFAGDIARLVRKARTSASPKP